MRIVGTLLLSGWLLLAPPMQAGGPDPAAPMAAWRPLLRFETTAECEATKMRLERETVGVGNTAHSHRNDTNPMVGLRCIPADPIPPPK